MSLLGPDDFGKGRKERAKKLAKDMSPEVSKQVERWLDEMEEAQSRERIEDNMLSKEEKHIKKRRSAVREASDKQ